MQLTRLLAYPSTLRVKRLQTRAEGMVIIARTVPRRAPCPCLRKPVLVPVALMPEWPLGLVYPSINGRGLGLLWARGHLGQNLDAEQADLDLSFGSCGRQPSLQGSPMGDAVTPQCLPQGGVFG